MAISYTSFVTPTGNVEPALNSGNFNAPFTNTATFSAGSGGSRAAGEYRQYVKGTFTVNGSVLTHVLCGSITIQADSYNEDGCPPQSCSAYGYRSCPDHTYDKYTPDRATGADFSMYDAPGFSNVSAGKTYSLNLSFEGKLIDTSLGGQVLASKSWTVIGSVTVPVTTFSMPSTMNTAEGMQSDEKIIGCRRSKNQMTGDEELHVVMVRRAGRPPLELSATPVVLVNAEGNEVPLLSPPQVHEIGSQKHSTVSIVCTPAKGSNAVVKALLHRSGGHIQAKLRDF